MGHRIEPTSQFLQLQTDSTGYTLESVIHIGLRFPNMTIIEPGIFQIDYFLVYKRRGPPLCV